MRLVINWWITIRIAVAIGYGLLLVSCQSSSNATLLRGKVTKVISGQTLEVVLPGNNRTQQVRIIGIDAPDWRQSPWGEAAKQKLQTLVEDKQIELETNNLQSDRFDRILAHVWHNKTLVGEVLVKDGYVLADTKYPNKYDRRLNYAQEYARLMNLGIWQIDRPMRLTPKEFRSQYSTK
jgi:micrococcal nuclease